uniref:Protein phosphatase 1 regulatory subunit 35 C-terminal domain-containing protein n=1 Tax=Megaselia scalaris TaxID=36166 RepID=T1GVF4_MEGSC
MSSNRHPFPVSVNRNVNFASAENYSVINEISPVKDMRHTGAIRKQPRKPVLQESNYNQHSRKMPDNFYDLTPRSKAAIMPSITKALNFRPDERVFGDLISLNVNDSILPEKVPFRNKYVFKGPKHPEPDLNDFLEPMESLTPPTIPLPDIAITIPNVEFDNFSKFKQYYKDVYGEDL